MTTQLRSRRRVAVFRAGVSAGALLLVLVVRERSMATPVFAQAHGTACYTQVPRLNAFGRYILDDHGAAVLAEVNGAGQGRLPIGGRWAKSDFARGKTLLQTAYLWNGVSPFGDASGYSRDAERPSQWRVAYAQPDQVGVFGETGALGFTGSALLPGLRVGDDNVVIPNTKKDPRLGSPRLGCEYVTATDGNPGYLSPRVAYPIQPAGSTVSRWTIGSARQMVEREHGVVNFSYYQTNQAPGAIGVRRLIAPTGFQTGGGPGFSYAINPYTRFSTTVYLQNQRPALSILMQFKPPLWSH